MATPVSPGSRGERLLAALHAVAAAVAGSEHARAASASLSPASLAVLEPLVDALALPAGELGRRSGLSSSALSHALARHEQAGLIERERQRGDGRVVLVRLTREGRRALLPARLAQARLADALEAEAPSGEAEALAARLEALAAALSGDVQRSQPRPGA